MNILAKLVEQIHLIGGVALFMIGLHTVVTHSNLIKKIMGLNIMGTGVFLFFVSIGNVEGGVPPIIVNGSPLYINPVPSALILTGIVVSVSVTVYSLSLVMRIFQTYGTIDAVELSKRRSEVSEHD